jgi:excisionase family DNA binding protein
MKLLNTSQASAVLGVSERRVRALIAEGKLTAQQVGRDYVITEEALGAVKVYGRAGRPPKAEPELVKKAAKKKGAKR